MGRSAGIIRGDEQEQHRIALEHNLQTTEIDFPLSSSEDGHPDDADNDEQPSLEYPRHHSEPSLHDMSAFVHRSRDGDDDPLGTMPRSHHGWSYRTMDDEEGINPYAYGGNDNNRTMSTFAHHASGVTFTAGLGGGRTNRRNRSDVSASMSVAEYDPDRPLHAMIAGVNSKHSMFDVDSKHITSPDPIVVDSTAELDRLLESGHAPPPPARQNRSASASAVQVNSPISSGSSSSDSERAQARHPHQQTVHHPSPRPKLTDHLRHVSFSPKRPRSAQAMLVSPKALSSFSSALAGAAQHQHPHSADESFNYNQPTPRASSKTVQVRLHPATPSTTGSKFTRMARGINKEIEAGREQIAASKASKSAAANASAANASTRANARPMPMPISDERNPFEAPSSRLPPPASSSGVPRKSSMREKDVERARERERELEREWERERTREFDRNLERTRERDFNTTLNKSKLYLPDVTGLTSAVESPMRAGTKFHAYGKAGVGARDAEARLLQTLTTVQSQLLSLQDENAISRRRVKELEYELEEAKRDVARERSRIVEREEMVRMGHISGMGKGNISGLGKGAARGYVNVGISPRKNKGKARARDTSFGGLGNGTMAMDMDEERLHERYREVVDEKKALESLLQSLRAHLTRLTTELASHQRLLTELRQLRDADASSLREKSAEIMGLKDEVQRLAGEVEVLRGVVEEGLRERRAVRESMRSELSELPSQAQGGSEESELSEEDDTDDESEVEGGAPGQTLDLDGPDPFDPVGVAAAAQAHAQGDKTMRTDHATLGSASLGLGDSVRQGPVRFVDEDDLQRIAAEVEERRSNRSGGSLQVSPRPAGGSPRLSPRLGSPTPRVSPRLAGAGGSSPRLGHEGLRERERERSPSRRARVDEDSDDDDGRPLTSRPSAPTPARATAASRPAARSTSPPDPSDETTPFPVIRGEHLERLFFAAPEHDAKTCTVCCRRQGRPHGGGGGWSPNGVPSSSHSNVNTNANSGPTAGPAYWKKKGEKEGLPPQTVVARVIRELEDDFTHYKSVYVELADSYKEMDAASDVRRRNTLAHHLREVVDILEQKGDQIAALYDLLSFRDRGVGGGGGGA